MHAVLVAQFHRLVRKGHPPFHLVQVAVLLVGDTLGDQDLMEEAFDVVSSSRTIAKASCFCSRQARSAHMWL